MNKKTGLIIGFIILLTLLTIGGYFLLIKDNNKVDPVFLKLEKIPLNEDRKITINKKEVIIKYQDSLTINDKEIDKEVVGLYSTNDYLIVAYKGIEKEKYSFINNEGNEIEVIKKNISDEAEFSNLRLDVNKLIADTNDGTVEISYQEGKITIKK